MEKVIDQFREHLYQLGYDKKKRQQFCAHANALLQRQRVTDITRVHQSHIKDFYEWLFTCPAKSRGGSGLAESTIAQYMYSLQYFFTWLEMTGQISHNPISGIKFKRHKKNRRQPLSIEQISSLFAVAADLQELAILHLFYSCGLRRMEAERLDIRDVQYKQQLLYVREGKGSKRRVIPLTARVAADLENYYAKHRHAIQAINGDGEKAFMLNSRGTRMKGCSYHSIFKKMMAKAVHPLPSTDISLHHLRHSIATHLLRSGMGMLYVKDFLGHDSLDTTQVYAQAQMEQLKSI